MILIIWLIVNIITSIANILGWLAKLRWSKEFEKAKNAEISSLKREISYHKEMNSEKVQKHYISTKKLLEDKIDQLENELEKTKSEFQEANRKNKELSLSRIEGLIYNYITDYTNVNNFPPSIKTMQNELGIRSVSVMAYNLKRLEYKGLIRREGGTEFN